MTGAAVQWLRDGLQIVGSAAETAAIAATVDATDGVVFVPALTGLGAPHWDPHARGTIIGITRGTTRAHLVRATLEAIAFEVRDVLETLPGAAAAPARATAAPAANDLLCQLQADQLGVAGRAAAARRDHRARSGLPRRARHRACGPPPTTCATTWQLDRRFEPAGDRERMDADHARWREAVERSKGWASL